MYNNLFNDNYLHIFKKILKFNVLNKNNITFSVCIIYMYLVKYWNLMYLMISFIFSNSDTDLMEDSEIYPIQNWKRLTSFSIYSVIFKKCRFLRRIAEFCPAFQSFSLIGTAPNSGCIFYNDVIYLLKTAKNLSFIR